MELLQHLLPTHRAGAEAEIVPLFAGERPSVAQEDLHPAPMLLREVGREFGIRVHLDALEEILHVITPNPLCSELRGQHLAVQECDRDQIGD